MEKWIYVCCHMFTIQHPCCLVYLHFAFCFYFHQVLIRDIQQLEMWKNVTFFVSITSIFKYVCALMLEFRSNIFIQYMIRANRANFLILDVLSPFFFCFLLTFHSVSLLCICQCICVWMMRRNLYIWNNVQSFCFPILMNNKLYDLQSTCKSIFPLSGK